MNMYLSFMQRMLLMLVGLVCTSYVSAYDFKVENKDGVIIYYDINGNDVTVSSEGVLKYEGDVKIPPVVTYDGKSYNVTAIGANAFWDCDNLTAIEIPSTVTSIGSNAFWSCGKLVALTVPGSVKSIGESAFSYCGIASLELSEGIETIGGSAFHGCDILPSIRIPSTVESIGVNAFGNTDALSYVSVAEDNTVYDSRNTCNAIIRTASNTLVTGCQTTVIPDGITTIDADAFWDCDNLIAIEIPSTVTSIGSNAFWSCGKLVALTVPGSVKSIGESAFSYCGIASLELSEGIETIGGSAFHGCDILTSIRIPSTVESIGANAFGNTDALSYVSVAEGNTVYDSRNTCNAIIRTASNTLVTGCQTTVIPDGITTIDADAFWDCDNLIAIEIPSTVTYIGRNAFWSCDKLTKVVSKIRKPFKIDSSVFQYIPSSAILYVPVGTKEAYESIGGWNFAEIIGMSEYETISFSNNPIRTFCSANPLDYTGVDGLTAYVASGFNAETGDVIMSKVEKVPAGTGLLLIGEAEKSCNVPISETDYMYSNLLVGVLENKQIETGFIFNGDLFEAIRETQTVIAGEAYLDIAIENVQQLNLRFTDPDEIESVQSSDKNHSVWHTLQGIRFNDKPVQRGIYLHNGRKVFVK